MRKWYRLGLVAHMQGFLLDEYLRMLRLDLVDPTGKTAQQVTAGWQSAEWRAQRWKFERLGNADQRRIK